MGLAQVTALCDRRLAWRNGQGASSRL